MYDRCDEAKSFHCGSSECVRVSVCRCRMCAECGEFDLVSTESIQSAISESTESGAEAETITTRLLARGGGDISGRYGLNDWSQLDDRIQGASAAAALLA